ncbi:MAG: aromatic ring-hydroxylating dioxygenase subunit alpha [Rhodospirillaceae bacterium]|nr:MAG: aromatic ring-hydroxylating dioxygenase subunit alpha [Rhodospirillaceae bacterium]
MRVVKTAAPPLRDVPLQVTNPERIPARRYYDEEFYKLECERVWPHVWQMACRLEEIPQVGDWIEYKILDKSVLVVRTKTGIKAFHNACRHRGMRLASGHGNCKTQGFICSFHGWRFNMDGENTFLFGRHLFSEKNLEKAELALAPCRVALWGGSAFINFDDNAPPLRECLGTLADRLEAHNVDKLKVEWWRSAVLPVNWKLAMEAFMEGYHVMRTHPQLQALSTPQLMLYGPDQGSGSPTPARTNITSREFVDLSIRYMERLSDGMAGMVHGSEVAIAKTLRDMEVPDDLDGAAMAFYGRLGAEITAQGRARGVPVPDVNQVAVSHPVKAVEFLFPHYFLLPMFSAMSSYRIRPLSPETCLFEIWSLALFPENEERERPVAPVPMPHDDPSFPEIPRQDYSNLPAQQLGLHAGGFEYMRLSKNVEGMISNYQRLLDGYIAGVEPSKLAKATQIVCSGFDSPIFDIGF